MLRALGEEKAMVLLMDTPMDAPIELDSDLYERGVELGRRDSELIDLAAVLTADEYDALPVTDVKIELVDGVIRAVPNPTGIHQNVAGVLWSELRRMTPGDCRPVINVGVRLSDLLRRIPDVVLLRSDGLDLQQHTYLPEQVVLAVEVMSPGSQTTDRLNKRVEYGAAGIEHFWRIETDPDILLYAYRLAEGDGQVSAYGEPQIFKAGDTVEVDGLAWARIDVAALGR
jgi:Uma2 family endonuclease